MPERIKRIAIEAAMSKKTTYQIANQMAIKVPEGYRVFRTDCAGNIYVSLMRFNGLEKAIEKAKNKKEY